MGLPRATGRAIESAMTTTRWPPQQHEIQPIAATRSKPPESPFFKLVAAGEGIWAAVATDFTAAVGNSAIVDLGGR